MSKPTVQILSKDFEVYINFKELEGSFEWVGGTNEDEEITGGLWFELDQGIYTLVEYDGVFELPVPVFRVLEDEGIEMDDTYTPSALKDTLIEELITDELESFQGDYHELQKFTGRLLRVKYWDTSFKELTNLAIERGVTE